MYTFPFSHSSSSIKIDLNPKTTKLLETIRDTIKTTKDDKSSLKIQTMHPD